MHYVSATPVEQIGFTLVYVLISLVTPAVYHTAPWRTQTAISGYCRIADCGAKLERSRNAADPYPVEIVVNSITVKCCFPVKQQ